MLAFDVGVVRREVDLKWLRRSCRCTVCCMFLHPLQ